MALESFATMVETLKRLRILDPKKLEEISRWPSGSFGQPYSLSRELIRRGWLTVYQANQLHQGNGRQLCVGRHRILDRLGEGGAGNVYKAWDTERECLAGLKVVRNDLLGNAEAIGRFKREIEVVTSLSHPNIVRALDANQAAGTLYLAMEFVEGTDINKLVKLSGKIAPDKVVSYIKQVCAGLQHAHERNLVHRDIKPANLLVVANSEVIKILDMGLACNTLPMGGDDSGNFSSKLTVEGSMLGSPDFMSPEQALRPSSVDIRADIYSLGATAYFMLTGQVPYPGNALLMKLMGHRELDPTPIESLAPDVPRKVIAVVKRMMGKQPDDRYPTPADVAKALA